MTETVLEVNPNNQVAKRYAQAGCQEEERELWGSEHLG